MLIGTSCVYFSFPIVMVPIPNTTTRLVTMLVR